VIDSSADHVSWGERGLSDLDHSIRWVVYVAVLSSLCYSVLSGERVQHV
jgi:hypothetical protein